MPAAAIALKTAQSRHIGSVVSFPAKKAVKPARIEPILDGVRWPSQQQRAAAAEYAAKALPGLLKDLEAPPIDDAAHARLERLIVWRGIEAVTLLIRTIIESEGNEDALTEFVIDGVADVMLARPDWPERFGIGRTSWAEICRLSRPCRPQGCMAIALRWTRQSFDPRSFPNGCIANRNRPASP